VVPGQIHVEHQWYKRQTKNSDDQYELRKYDW